MSKTIEIDIETASRLPQGWAPWVGSPGLDPQALHTYLGFLFAVISFILGSQILVKKFSSLPLTTEY